MALSRSMKTVMHDLSQNRSGPKISPPGNAFGQAVQQQARRAPPRRGGIAGMAESERSRPDKAQGGSTFGFMGQGNQKPGFSGNNDLSRAKIEAKRAGTSNNAMRFAGQQGQFGGGNRPYRGGFRQYLRGG